MMASRNVSDAPSCISIGCIRTPPKGSRAHSVGARAIVLKRQALPFDLVHVLAVMLLHRDSDAIARADVVQQEVAVGMECLVSERLGNGEFPAIHRRARGCGGQSRDMANVTADAREQRFAFI